MTTVRVLDIETTGMAPPDEVVELGWCDVVDGQSLDTWDSVIYSTLRPCPPEVLAVHHILPGEQEGRPLFDLPHADVTMSIMSGRSYDYICAHNVEFEDQWLGGLCDPQYQLPAPRWICTYKSALRVWPEAPSHSNQALMYWLGLHEELDAENRHPPHRAGPDAYVTAAILARLTQHASLEAMVHWTMEPRLLPRCPIGKFRGRLWPEVDQGFLGWCLRQPDMEEDIKWNVRRELSRRRGFTSGQT